MTNVVSVMGKQDTWPFKVWVSDPQITFTAQTNRGKFCVYATPDIVPGPRLVRLYNDEGSSEPRIFVIDAAPGIVEVEPNNHFAKAQFLSRAPLTIDGRLEKSGDVDSFAFLLKEGQVIQASVDSYGLMSKVDAALRLMTTNGVQLAWNHDFVTLDPQLVWKAISNDTVVVQIFGFAFPPGSDIRLAGGEITNYRLHLEVSDRVLNPCLQSADKVTEPRCNDCPAYQMPFSIQGRISSAEQEERVPVHAEKDDIIEARLEASSIGSPLDAWLKIEDAAGKELVRNDDEDGSRDPRLEWKVQTNGVLNVVIGSVTHRGGEDYCYKLSVRRMMPDFRATLSSSSLAMTSGTTNELKFDIKRIRGHTNELVARIHGLPDCVTNLPARFPTKDGVGVIQLKAAVDACEFQGPIQVFVKDVITGTKRGASFNLTGRGEGSFTRLLIDGSEDFFLTVRSKPSTNRIIQGKP